MAANVIGIDVSVTALRITVCDKRGPVRFFEARLPDNMVRDNQIVSWDAMGDFLKETLKNENLRVKEVCFTVPESAVYIQHVVLPPMSEGQLKVNLPYEFHDYINRDMDKYIYDYAVNHIDTEKMDLLAVAVSCDLVDRYTAMCRRAGLRLRILAPDVIAFRNLLRAYGEDRMKADVHKDYAILDLGDESAHLHFFTNGEFEVTRSLDTGCLALVEPIAAATGIDPHLILMGQSGTLTEQAEQSNETFLDQCNNLALSVMRVLNFYSYNNPNNSINALYVCGAGIRLKPLINEIAANIELPLLPATELIPQGVNQPENLAVAPQSYGICVGKEG